MVRREDMSIQDRCGHPKEGLKWNEVELMPLELRML